MTGSSARSAATRTTTDAPPGPDTPRWGILAAVGEAVERWVDYRIDTALANVADQSGDVEDLKGMVTELEQRVSDIETDLP